MKPTREKLLLAASLLSLSMGAEAALAPSLVHAGGFELSGTGTRGLGRAGAYAARVDDSLALALNPAALADADTQLLLNATLMVWDACVTRSGTYGGGGDPGGLYTGGGTIFSPRDGEESSPWAARAFPRVCNGGMPQVVPQIMANVRVTNELGVGFGIIAPNGIGTARWGNDDGTITVDGQRLPTPVRYMETGQDLLLFYPSVGVGYRPFDWLSVGLTLQWGIGIIDYMNYTNSGTAASGSPATIVEDPSADIRTHLSVVDPFVPAGILSLHFTPIDALDIVVSAHISDAVGGVVPASGSLELTTGTYGRDDDISYVPTLSRIENTTLSAGQPFQFTLALRYADRIRPRATHRTAGEALAGQVDDAMVNENFDLELDVVYEQLSQVTDFVVTMPAGSSGQLRQGGAGGMTTSVPIPTPLPIAHGWSDVVTMRLGSDVNVIPGTLAIRAGASFELPVDDRYRRYLQNDFIGGWRLGLHAGATLRVERFDLSLAYGFFLGETIDVSPSTANFRQINATRMEGACPGTASGYDPSRPVPSLGCYPSGFGAVVNAGRYEQMHHAISLGMSYHF